MPGGSPRVDTTVFGSSGSAARIQRRTRQARGEARRPLQGTRFAGRPSTNSWSAQRQGRYVFPVPYPGSAGKTARTPARAVDGVLADDDRSAGEKRP